MLIGAALTLAVGLVAEPARRDGLFLWAAGLAAHTTAYSLLALRGVAHDVITIVLPNGLLSVTFACFGEALCRFYGRQPDRRLLWLPVVVCLLCFSLLMRDVTARLLAGPLVFGVQILTLAVLILRGRAATPGRGQYFLLFGLAALLPVLGLRAAMALGGDSSLANFEAPSTLQTLTFLTVMVSTLFATLGYVLMCKEVADHRNQRLAMIDELTGLPNRRSTLQGLAQQLAAVHRSGQPLTVMMVDVDHFKRVNDQHGHLVGDAALRHLAKTLRTRLRGQDLLGRLGGEEFLALLPATAATPGGLALAESLRAAVAANPMGGQGLTISIGVAAVEADQDLDVQAVISAADRALYRAKAAGRDRVEAARPADFELVAGSTA